MKIYEKPMAIVNRFEVEDVIAESYFADAELTLEEAAEIQATGANQGVIFQW